ncbi:transposase domain-containing protein [Bradyrhizobium sp. NBAIM03]|nr:transposase domain-containing protein [Bradyrhizobium sp. NBAIM14]MCA1531005.1 transposase domain-containing protein [Bradyrhizobium sp. NBAIM03]
MGDRLLIITTAKLSDVEPLAYPEDVLQRMPNGHPSAASTTSYPGIGGQQPRQLTPQRKKWTLSKKEKRVSVVMLAIARGGARLSVHCEHERSVVTTSSMLLAAI